MDTSNIQESSTPESPKIIYDFLASHHTGVLATVNKYGQPHGAVIYFLMDDDFTIMFGTKTQTRKYTNIAKNPTATLVVYDEKSQITTVIEGEVTPSGDDPDVVHKVIRNMETQSAKTIGANIPPIAKLFAGDLVAMRLVPHSIRTAIFIRPDNQGYDEFETVTFRNHQSHSK